MKFLIVLLTFIALANCRYVNNVQNAEEKLPRFVIISDSISRIEIIDTQQPVPRVTVEEDEVTFHYKSRNTPSIEMNVFTIKDIISKTDFNAAKRTMFIIHGWNNNKDSDLNKEISEALLKIEDWNVFIVDWHKKANAIYTTSLGAVPHVGEITAKFIQLLQEITNLKPENLHISGHSLGAHVAGRAGAVLNGEVAVIVGMDPAMPLVSYDNVTKRLDPTDARHVHVIHTCGGKLGFLRPVGHADFYPNGGEQQKGCILDFLGTCAHGRSHVYFAESIISDSFVANLCDSYEDFKNGLCDTNEEANLGGNRINTKAKGTYYLDTAKAKPYALG